MLYKIISQFKKITVGFQAFQVVRYGFLLLITFAFARIFEDKTVIAEYEKLVLYGGSLTFFWVSGIFNSFIPLYHNLEAPSGRKLISQTFLISLVFALVSAAGLYALGYAKLPQESRETLLWFTVFILFNSASYLVKYYMIVKNRSFLLLGYGSLIYLLHFLFIVVPLALGYSLKTSMQLMAGLGAAKFIFQFFLVRKDLFPLVMDRQLVRRQLALAVPLILALLLGGSSTYIDAYLIESFLPDEIFALFQYGARELPLVMILANAMSTTQSGEVMQAIKKGESEKAYISIRKGGNRLQHIFFPLTMVLLLSSDWLYEVVYNGQFALSARIFDIYLMLIIPRLLFPQTILKGYLKNNILMVTSGIELVINASLSVFFLFLLVDQPELAIQGVALATLIGFAFEKVFLVLWCKFKLKVGLREYTRVLIWLGYSLVLALVFGAKFWYANFM